MDAPTTFSELGPVMQLAYVPRDFDAALDHWTKVIGAGPFFLLENVALDELKVMGQPSAHVFTMALGYWGEMQIELIRPDNAEPTIYRGEYAPGEGLHHVCILVDDIADARSVCAATGAKVVAEAKVAGGGAVI